MQRAGNTDALDAQEILKETPRTLRRRIEIVMGEAVQRLQERHAAIELASALQHSRDLCRAAEWIADMFQNRNRKDRVECIALEGQLFADPDYVGRIVADDFIIDDILEIN